MHSGDRTLVYNSLCIYIYISVFHLKEWVGGNHFCCVSKIAHPPHPAIFNSLFRPLNAGESGKPQILQLYLMCQEKSVRIQININLYELTFNILHTDACLDMMFCK